MLRLFITAIASAAVWILFVAGIKPEEMIVGGICVLFACWFMYDVSKHDCPDIHLRFIDWVQVWRVPGYLLLDSCVILSVLAKDILHIAPAPSLFRAAPFEYRQDQPLDIARRVLAIAYTTATPNMIIIGIDVQRGQMLFHQLQRSDIPKMTRNLGALA